MGAILANTPIEPAVVAIQVSKICFEAPCKYCGDGRRASTNIRPVDYIGRPLSDLNLCGSHAEQLVWWARVKNLEISVRVRCSR